MNKNWNRLDDKISRTFIFKDFNEALNFLNQVGDLAEKNNHHPDLQLFDYKKVKITLTTHSENKVTEKDWGLASEIDSLI